MVGTENAGRGDPLVLAIHGEPIQHIAFNGLAAVSVVKHRADRPANFDHHVGGSVYERR